MLTFIGALLWMSGSIWLQLFEISDLRQTTTGENKNFLSFLFDSFNLSLVLGGVWKEEVRSISFVAEQVTKQSLVELSRDTGLYALCFLRR